MIELMIVIAVLAILIALGVGQIRRYRATVALRTAVDKLVNDIQSTTRQLARASGCAHTGITRQTAQLSQPGGTLTARIVRKINGQNLEVLQTYLLGDQGGNALPLTITAVTLLPRIDYSAITAQGLALEVGQTQANGFAELFCVPIEPDGTLWTDPAQVSGVKTGSFVLSNDFSKTVIEISPTGNVKVTDNVP